MRKRHLIAFSLYSSQLGYNLSSKGVVVHVQFKYVHIPLLFIIEVCTSRNSIGHVIHYFPLSSVVLNTLPKKYHNDIELPVDPVQIDYLSGLVIRYTMYHRIALPYCSASTSNIKISFRLK
ncbi:unnamed protein product [Heterobilharzia americana]|nr:unnamed protein product [Heterobilharzia americana]